MQNIKSWYYIQYIAVFMAKITVNMGQTLQGDKKTNVYAENIK